jgi:hypothetical protein
MDLLENYKKAWVNQPKEKEHFSELEIYKMAHSKSSSIVKWIFIIGILEFIFWISISLFTPESFYEGYEELNLDTFVMVTSVFHYVVIIGFLYLFYKNYANISLADDTKKLIRKILKVRKTVQFYVYYNIAVIVLFGLFISGYLFSDTDLLVKVLKPDSISVDINQLVTITIVSVLIAILIAIVFFWLFYKIIYGILLRKLNRNFKELTRLEVDN